MSKIVRKCPNCGATMPADVKYCRKCHAKLDSGRVENLAGEMQQKKNRKRSRDDDALRNLPKPVRPVEEEDMAAPVAAGEGFFNPEHTEGMGQRRPIRRPVGEDGEPIPQPVSTARGTEAYPPNNKRSDRNLWQIIAVLAVILVIIVVAVVLVIKLNRPSGNVQQTGSVPPGSSPLISEQMGAPEASPVQASPTALPTPSAPPATPVPSPTPTVPPASPVPSATPAPNYTVTAMNDTVYVINGPVNLRPDPSQNFDPITQIQTGTALTRTGVTNTGWSRISYNGQQGFVANNYLTTNQPSSGGSSSTGSSTGSSGGSSYSVTEASGTVTVATTSGANLRTGPGETYSVYTTVSAGTQLTRTGTSGNWTRVSYNGQTLFISTGLLQGNYTGSNYSVTEESGTGTVKTTSGGPVNLRSGPGTGYNSLAQVSSGSTVTITGKSANWYRVEYGGQTGYIRDDYVTKN